MKYCSTRDSQSSPTLLTASQAIQQGLAPDGGLYVPQSIPRLTEKDFRALCALSYPERAASVLAHFLTDYTAEELQKDCADAYRETAFSGGAAPLCSIKGFHALYSLELWHGPTAAFKDMALQLMPRLLSRALVKNQERRRALILVATSGDTGKAALEGFCNVPGTGILVFYPCHGVSRVQELQMLTQQGENVGVCAIRGNFDDAQSGVKKIFGDPAIAQKLEESGWFLSSANSINWGRLAPQIVYYISAYCDLLNRGEISFGAPLNLSVPTGNFGNILAAYFAKKMGLPLRKLICASNVNHILTDFLRTGIYDRNRDFHLTMSPSMDILISSNLERLLYLALGAEKTNAYMQSLAQKGCYAVDEADMAIIRQDFAGYYADEIQTADTIRCIYERGNYLCDTHTAVGLHAALEYRKETGDNTPMVVASTASPYKFAGSVYQALSGKEAPRGLAALEALETYTARPIPYPLAGLEKRTLRFDGVIGADEMPQEVLHFISQ